MTFQGLFLSDGKSDRPLSGIVESVAGAAGFDLLLTPVDEDLLPSGDRTVAGRLRYLMGQRVRFDILFVHRDAEAQEPERRVEEVERGAAAAGVQCPVVPVVPIRMTEAWLLLDEQAIREVAGNPRGREPLRLPTPAEAERLADPKARLQALLVTASGTTGRRRDRVTRDFPRLRGLLLERLDIGGPVTELTAWRQMTEATVSALASLVR